MNDESRVLLAKALFHEERAAIGAAHGSVEYFEKHQQLAEEYFAKALDAADEGN